MATVYEIVTEKILAALAAGVAPWRKTWCSAGGEMPTSMATKRSYRGSNVVLLSLSAMAAGYSSPWWGTYEQIKQQGGQVRKGEHSTLVVFWRRTVRREEGDDGGEKERAGYLLRYFSVFNEEQADWTDGSPFAPKEGDEATPKVEPIEAAQVIWEGYEGKPALSHGGDRAFYSPGEDSIRMPKLEAFESPEQYHSVLFHEATHSMGHAKRLGREGIEKLGPGHGFGSPSYAKEELVAEMGAAFLCAVAGIESAATLEVSAAYLKHWSERLREDPRLFVSAAAQAQRAADHVLGRKFEQNGEG